MKKSTKLEALTRKLHQQERELLKLEQQERELLKLKCELEKAAKGKRGGK